MNKKNFYFLIISIVLIIFLSFILIKINNKGNNKEEIQGIIVTKDSSLEYVPSILKEYSEYVNMLNKYNINDEMFLTNNSFTNNDYIVDFLDYEDGLIISNINLKTDGKNNTLIGITYTVSKKVENSDKYLIYFIPIEKNMFNNINMLNKEFLLDN